MDTEGRKRGGRKEEREKRNWKSNRNSPVTALRLPTGLGPVATGSGKRSYHLQTIIKCPHLDLLSAPVTRPVSVTNSNKHPKLITLLPLNPTVSKKHQKLKKKSHPQPSSCGVSFSFFTFFFSSIPSFMFNCYEAHVCSYAKLSKVWVRFTSHLVTVQWGRAAVGCFIAGFLTRPFYTVMQYISPLMLFTDSCLWVPTCYKVCFALIKRVNWKFCKM